MGTLYLVSTPVGNLEDITLRAARLILTSPFVACEDTRRTGQLIRHLTDSHAAAMGIVPDESQRLVSYRDENEQTEAYGLLEKLKTGSDVVLVSDAGTPLISDPGYVLVREALRQKIPVTAVPGASSVMAAVVLSGLPVHRFTYVGFPPEKSGHRRKFLTEIASMKEETIVMLCSPHKFHTLLTEMLENLGDIRIVVLRELTKLHEERIEGNVSTILERADTVRGEIVIVFRTAS